MFFATETLDESLDLTPESSKLLIKVRHGDVLEHRILLLLLLLLHKGLQAIEGSAAKES